MKIGLLSLCLCLLSLLIFWHPTAFAKKKEETFKATYQKTNENGRTDHLVLNITTTQASDLFNSAIFGTNAWSQRSFSEFEVRGVVNTVFNSIFRVDYPSNRFIQFPKSVRDAVMASVRVKLSWDSTMLYLQPWLLKHGHQLSNEEKAIVDKFLDMLLIQNYLVNEANAGRGNDMMWTLEEGWKKLTELSINLSFQFRHDLRKGEDLTMMLLAIFDKYIPSARDTLVRSAEFTAGLNTNDTIQTAKKVEMMVQQLQKDVDQKYSERLNLASIQGTAVGIFAVISGLALLQYFPPDVATMAPALMHPLTQALFGVAAIYTISWLNRLSARFVAIQNGLKDNLAKSFDLGMKHNFLFRGLSREWEGRGPKDCRMVLLGVF